MNFKKILGGATVALTALAVTSSLANARELRMGHTGAPNHHYQQISTEFADAVAARTNNQLTIAVFPSDQLGNQMESTEGVMIGTQDMVLTSDTVLSNWIPDMGILNLPFLVQSGEAYLKLVNGPVGDQLAKQVEDHGAVILGWWDNGLRHITNSKRPINTPDDLAGLSIRVPEGEIFVDTFKALGAGPTVMSFGELYSALQLGTVDGQENPVAHIVTQNFFEVQKYVSRTGHIHMGSPLIINKDLFESLPEDQQKVLLEEGRKFSTRHVKLVEQLEAEQWAEVERHGMKINDVDAAPFREKVQPVYDKAAKKLNADLIKQAEAELGS